MKHVAFDGTFAGWRAAARDLLEAGVLPADVLWHAEGEAQPVLAGLGLEPQDDASEAAGAWPEGERPPPPASERFRVPRAYVALAQTAACHRDGERWALLYRVLWRLTHGEPKLLEVSVDPDVHRLLQMEKAIRRESHKMKAFVRFRAVEHEGEPHYVAWYEPVHDVVEHTAPFFERRFASMRWSILTPHRCAHWDGAELSFTPGVPRSAAPGADALESLWRTYYASIFNPARLKTRAMRAEMPKKFWKNLPEAALIPDLVADAPARVRRMIVEQNTPRPPKQRRPRLKDDPGMG